MNTDTLIDQFVAAAQAAGVQIWQEDNEAAIARFEGRSKFRCPPAFRSLASRYRYKVFDAGSLLLAQTKTGEPAGEWGKPVGLGPEFRDFLWNHGLVQFTNFGGGCQSDPICFDLSFTKPEFPIVRVEHEIILCENRLGKRHLVYPSFIDFIQEQLKSPRFEDNSDYLEIESNDI